jgi:tRNA(Ile2) C34 agmatinyltransferase TiaS
MATLEVNMATSEDVQERNGILRFRVSVGEEQITAFISRATCRARDEQVGNTCSLADFYLEQRATLEGIVTSKVQAGARQPVVVMAEDLCNAAQAAPRRPKLHAKANPAGHQTLRPPDAVQWLGWAG